MFHTELIINVNFFQVYSFCIHFSSFFTTYFFLDRIDFQLYQYFYYFATTFAIQVRICANEWNSVDNALIVRNNVHNHTTYSTYKVSDLLVFSNVKQHVNRDFQLYNFMLRIIFHNTIQSIHHSSLIKIHNNNDVTN